MQRPARLIVASLALVHAVLFAFYQQPDWNVAWTDQGGYRQLGAVLAQHGLFTRFPDSARFVPEVIRTPGYPVFVAIVYALFGVGNQAAVAGAQAIVFAGICLLVYAIARRAAGPREAIVAATLTALFAPLPYYGALVMTEIWTTLLLTATMWCCFRALDTSQLRYSVFAGLLAAATALTRPVFILLPVGLFAAGALASDRRRLRPWMVAIGVAALSVAPWFLYNYANLGRISMSPAGGLGRATWEGSWQGRWSGRVHNELTQIADRTPDRAALHAEVDAVAERVGADPRMMERYVDQWQDIRKIWTTPIDPYERAIARIDADNAYMRVGIDNIRQDPFGWLKRRLTYGQFVLWAAHVPVRYTDINSLPIAVVRMFWIAQVVLLALAAYGLVTLVGSGRWREALLLAMPALYITAVHFPLLTESRQSLPAMPSVLVLTSIAAYRLAASFRRVPSVPAVAAP